MSKPSIFFSHSSKDGPLLSNLKNILQKNTGGAFDIFLSSDGQSIPFGRNWVFEIQEALEQTDAVFIFVSPQSIQSGWVYFEAGFTYSKKKKVIPVGILGTQIGLIPPPLGLLNGFDMSSADGGNKLIGTINEIMEHNHSYRFSDADFSSIFQQSSHGTQSIFGEMVDSIYVTGRSEKIANELKGSTFPYDRELPTVAKILKISQENDWLNSSKFGSSVSWPGMDVIFHDSYEENFRISIHGPALEQNIPILKELIDAAIEINLAELTFTLNLNEHLAVDGNTNRQTFALQGTGVEFAPEKKFQYGALLFELRSNSMNIDPGTIRIIGENAQIIFHMDSDMLHFDDLSELLKLLLDKRLIQVAV